MGAVSPSFGAIVLSNGWDDATAALQLLSHLEGDALNVVLLVLESRRAIRVGLVGALTAYYGSPRRLADYRRQFEMTTRTVGEDPSIFAVALETLAVKAFGDMGQGARLRIIRDRFIAGHASCELRRHLDSVAPETPIRDIADRYRVWDNQRISRPGPERALPIYTVNDADWGGGGLPRSLWLLPLHRQSRIRWSHCSDDCSPPRSPPHPDGAATISQTGTVKIRTFVATALGGGLRHRCLSHHLRLELLLLKP